MKKKIVLLMMSALMTASAVCSGVSAEEGTTVTFWHAMGGTNGEALTYLVDKFNAENTEGITVEAVYQGSYDDSINKLKSAQMGNMGADLVQIYDIGTRFMVDSGWVIPMQELIEANGYDISQIEENCAAYYTVDGQLYSMPFNSSTPLLYYNKTLFDAAGITEIPSTYDEIAAVGDQLLDAGAGEVLAAKIYGWFFEQYLCKQGLDFVNNENGRSEEPATAVAFDENGGGLNILTKWNELYEMGYAPNVGRNGNSTDKADFTSGKAAMLVESTAALTQILTEVNGAFEVGTAYYPGVVEAEGGVSIGGASLWALDNGEDTKADAVWSFVEFLISPESQAYWNAMTGYFPITTAAHEEEMFKENIAKYPQFQTAIDQLHDSAPQYAGALVSVFPEARAIIETEMENMVNGNLTPEEALVSMTEQINMSIEDYNLLNE